MQDLYSTLEAFAEDILAKREEPIELIVTYGREIRRRIFSEPSSPSMLIYLGILSKAEYAEWQKKIREEARKELAKTDDTEEVKS